MNRYTAPIIEQIEICDECGFSLSSAIDGWGNDGSDQGGDAD